MCANYEGPSPENKAELEKKARQEMFGYVPHDHWMRPTNEGTIIMPVEDRLECRQHRWGFHFVWDDRPYFNARCETIKTKAFKSCIDNRCLVPARAFIEGGPTFYRPERDVFCFAGLWQDHKEHGLRFTILTCEPNETVAPHKTRMPFILRDDHWLEWLRGDWEKVLAKPDLTALEKQEKIVPVKISKAKRAKPAEAQPGLL